MENGNSAEESYENRGEAFAGEADESSSMRTMMSTTSEGGDEAAESTSSVLPASPPSPPPASQHSYFPGASHPLHSTTTGLASIADAARSSSFDHYCSTFDLVIIELPGVVLVPGMTIPLRLEEPSSFASSSGFWMLYRQIQDSRRSPGQAATVQVGILTKLDPEDEQELSMGAAPGENENTIQRRRSSWMRRRFGPERLRRFSEQLIQEMGDIQTFLEAVESVDQEVVDDSALRQPRRASRQRRSRIRRQRLLRRWEDASDDDQEATNGQDVPQQDQQQQEEIEFLHRRRSVSRSTDDNDDRRANGEATSSSTTTTRQQSDDPYAGRIGTLATVTCTHGDDDEVLGRTNIDSMVGNHTNQQPRPRASLILTAVGTGRFRIPYRSTGNTTNNHQQHRPNTTAQDPFNFSQIFVRPVQEWSYERIPLTTVAQPHYFRDSALATTASPKLRYGQSTLASVSVWPKYVYDVYWPWNLMQDIKRRMGAVPSLNEILVCQEKNLPHHPFQFSYWLAMNLPLSERERLQVLYCPTVTERLQWFQRHSLFDFDLPCDDGDATGRPEEMQQPEQQQQDPSDFKDFTCKSCQIPVAPARSLFTLGGAEGTVGNYVNEFGAVHATMTVREVDLNEVEFMGQPETKNSWFPGYAWTIMRCALCYAHLGWKFTRANDTRPVSSTWPMCFYGLSGSGVTLTTNIRLQRRSTSWRQNFANNTRRIRQRSVTDASTA
ncbi:hypothetical protein ACA910_005885 [Epithemia clementina (nom. ined.)]